MRLTPEQARPIVAPTRELAGPDTSVRLFGSRLRDKQKGRSIYGRLLEVPARPGKLNERFSA